MSRSFRLKQRVAQNAEPNINYFAYRLVKPDGKFVYGNRKEIVELAIEHDVDRVFYRIKKIWFFVDRRVRKLVEERIQTEP